MPVKKILVYPAAEKTLKTKSAAVRFDDPRLREILADMRDTLLATPNGVGLAAVQIGYTARIFMLRKDFIADDLDDSSSLRYSADPVITFINPKIISGKGDIFEEEGCLSVPGKYLPLKRFRAVKVKAFDEQGKPFSERLSGLGARAVQQEMDHLNGILIIDRAE